VEAKVNFKKVEDRIAVSRAWEDGGRLRDGKRMVNGSRATGGLEE
jgi:hypothetical protein